MNACRFIPGSNGKDAGEYGLLFPGGPSGVYNMRLYHPIARAFKYSKKFVVEALITDIVGPDG
ncbi:MAG: hypothetical protein COA94_07775 [Rickettsiales bacterium]|nr:MAG: hypothetical protein COA94_07775 [Rickettsiales bacterium]